MEIYLTASVHPVVLRIIPKMINNNNNNKNKIKNNNNNNKKLI